MPTEEGAEQLAGCIMLLSETPAEEPLRRRGRRMRSRIPHVRAWRVWGETTEICESVSIPAVGLGADHGANVAVRKK